MSGSNSDESRIDKLTKCLESAGEICHSPRCCGELFVMLTCRRVQQGVGGHQQDLPESSPAGGGPGGPGGGGGRWDCRQEEEADRGHCGQGLDVFITDLLKIID